jgi:hypothetical protein
MENGWKMDGKWKEKGRTDIPLPPSPRFMPGKWRDNTSQHRIQLYCSVAMLNAARMRRAALLAFFALTTAFTAHGQTGEPKKLMRGMWAQPFYIRASAPEMRPFSRCRHQ